MATTWGTAAKPPKKTVPKKPTFITGANGNRIQVNPDGTRYVIKRAGGGTQGITTGGIETPKQIEARVRRLADESFARNKSVYDADAKALRDEAEGRRLAMLGAYQAAAKLNSDFGGKVQSGWNTAADTIQGLAGAGSGSVADALRADVATQDAALARVGAPGTGFDATSQQGVEMYRGGTLPAESFGRYGGIGNEFFQRSANALNLRGIQEGAASYGQEIAGINKDLTKSIRELTAGRSDYETKLREQLLGARSDQQDYLIKQAEFEASQRLDRLKVEQAQQKIDLDYQKAKLDATTQAQKLALDRWYKEQNVILSGARNAISQQNANIAGVRAATGQANAATAATRAADARVKSALDAARSSILKVRIAGTKPTAAEYARIFKQLSAIAVPRARSKQETTLIRQSLDRLVRNFDYAGAKAAGQGGASTPAFDLGAPKTTAGASGQRVGG